MTRHALSVVVIVCCWWHGDSSTGGERQNIRWRRRKNPVAYNNHRPGSRRFPSVSSTGAPEKSSVWPSWPIKRSFASCSAAVLASSSATRVEEEADDDFEDDTFSETFHNARRQAGRIVSNIRLHSPPALPAFLALSAFPRKGWRLPPLVRNPFCRSVVGAAVGAALISWFHTDWYRRRSLRPLGTMQVGDDTLLGAADLWTTVHDAELPPFLPEELPLPPFVAHDEEYEDYNSVDDNEDDEEDYEDDFTLWDQFLTALVNPLEQWQEWNEHRIEEQRITHNLNRKHIYSELVEMQESRRKERRAQSGISSLSKWGSPFARQERSSGQTYALVTGASRGIGRAIAVELARWEIPSILVARDTDRLRDLATDLDKCYGVKCCVLQADLTKPQSAERIFETVKRAGIQVDVLVNNAGVASHGDVVDRPLVDIHKMLHLNTVSTAALIHLFGGEMKKRRHGRILMVSSVSGSVAGVPTESVYSATKAFQTSLATAMAKEMEPFGVGVTCLMPGAVRGTEFQRRSGARNAFCWQLPGYPKSPAYVATRGVQALLCGQTEVTPGWENQVFIGVLKPLLPPRLHNLLAEVMWNPVGVGFDDSSGLEEDEEVSARSDEEEPVSLERKRMMETDEPESPDTESKVVDHDFAQPQSSVPPSTHAISTCTSFPSSESSIQSVPRNFGMDDSALDKLRSHGKDSMT